MDGALTPARRFLGLRPRGDGGWLMDMVPTVVTPARALMGGAGLGAVLEVAEAVTGRPVLCGTAQYLATVGPPAVGRIEVETADEGRRITQAVGHLVSPEARVLTAHISLGARDFPHRQTYRDRPGLPAPEDCRLRPPLPEVPGSAFHGMEMRQALGRTYEELDGTPGTGRSALWHRLADGPRVVGVGDLAFVGDFVTSHAADAIGRRISGTSLDNTLRVVDRVRTAWILSDVEVNSVGNGVAQCTNRLWADDGTLLAIAGQTLLVRAFTPRQ